MINFNLYNHVILDFDGVILDSNKIKQDAIFQSSKDYLEDNILSEFVNYFISNNGIPREIKIAKYFSDIQEYNKVLDNYNSILLEELLNAKFTNSFEQFLRKLDFYNVTVYILSGGDRDEIVSLLRNRNVLEMFDYIMGGPKTKYENLDELNLSDKILYIGDSKIDYEIAQYYKYDFIFMYGYTQFYDWKEYFKTKKDITIIRDLETIINSKC